MEIKMETTQIYLEDIYSDKKHLGSTIKFIPKTLVIKENVQGVKGIFTTKALAENVNLMSVTRTGSSLTLFRAYDEAREFLLPLGNERFYLDKFIIQASALYLRWTDKENAKKDILVTSNDLLSEYNNSPMICYGSTELIELRHKNSKNYRFLVSKAAALQRLLNILKVDEEYFRALLAYTQSRTFNTLGIIPVFDWINSATEFDANTALSFSDQSTFSFTTTKAIEAGDELLWSYNRKNAIDTWFAYGYIDPLRPIVAQLKIQLTEDELYRIKQVLVEKFNLAPENILTFLNADPTLWTVDLICYFKDLPSSYRELKAKNESIQSFNRARMLFRLLQIVRDGVCDSKLSYKILTGEIYSLDLAFEQSVLRTMRTALQEGLQDLHLNVQQFGKSRFGGVVDLSPYIQMRTAANNQWDEIFNDLENICAAPSLDSLIPELRIILNNNHLSQENIVAIIDKNISIKPSARLELIKLCLVDRKVWLS